MSTGVRTRLFMSHGDASTVMSMKAPAAAVEPISLFSHTCQAHLTGEGPPTANEGEGAAAAEQEGGGRCQAHSSDGLGSTSELTFTLFVLKLSFLVKMKGEKKENVFSPLHLTKSIKLF